MSSPTLVNQQQSKEEENKNSETITVTKDDLVTTSTAVNPTLAENDCEEQELERLKGDAIGDTLYSERFVLNTILKLGNITKDLQSEDELERDLCSLWDMTIERDIVLYMLEQDVLEIFADIIKTTNDKRLTEILVGILANLCSEVETREKLEAHDDIAQVLLELASCMDALTLEQLMRLWAVVFVKMHDESSIKWYGHILKSDQFLENLCFILSNAASNTLILQTMETLNAILAKFTVMVLPEDGKLKSLPFEKVFIKSFLVEATIEAFTSLIKDDSRHAEAYEKSEIPESVVKARQTFCNIHSILSQYGETSKESYESHNDKMLWCLKEMLKPIMNNLNVSLWNQYEQDVLECLDDVLRVIPQPFDLEISQYMFKLYFDVSNTHDKLKNKTPKKNDFEDDTDEGNALDYQQIMLLILNTIYFLILKSDKDALKECISSCPQKHVTTLMESFKEPLDTESLKACYQKLTNALEIE